MASMIDGRLYESLRADEVREGDTIHYDGEHRAVYGVERESESSVTLFMGTDASVAWEDRGTTTQWNSNPIWVSAYDARVTGRRTGDCWGAE